MQGVPETGNSKPSSAEGEGSRRTAAGEAGAAATRAPQLPSTASPPLALRPGAWLFPTAPDMLHLQCRVNTSGHATTAPLTGPGPCFPRSPHPDTDGPFSTQQPEGYFLYLKSVSVTPLLKTLQRHLTPKCLTIFQVSAKYHAGHKPQHSQASRRLFASFCPSTTHSAPLTQGMCLLAALQAQVSYTSGPLHLLFASLNALFPVHPSCLASILALQMRNTKLRKPAHNPSDSGG